MRARQFLIAVLVLLEACAQFGLTPPKSFDEQVAYGYASLASVRTSAANALTTHTISLGDAQHVQVIADEARSALDAGRVAYSSDDTTTALARVQLADSILIQLANYLNNAKGAK